MFIKKYVHSVSFAILLIGLRKLERCPVHLFFKFIFHNPAFYSTSLLARNLLDLIVNV